MAKARFHKSQRVFVKPVGTWAHIESVVPKWIRGCDEPIKVLYDCGMGREFGQEELEEETSALARGAGLPGEKVEWRVLRGQNRWKSAEQCGHHPYPGTHPVLVTTERDWGGWRVPGAEYDLDPFRIEQQAQMLVRAPVFYELMRLFVQQAESEPENLGFGMTELAQIARRALSEIDHRVGAISETESVAAQPTPGAVMFPQSDADLPDLSKSALQHEPEYQA